ncbi:MAG: hypothetical protein U9N87_01640 [Planctomycetota bacterium]|nr:hypothetical protein [Planctomycetota bacterium]
MDEFVSVTKVGCCDNRVWWSVGAVNDKKPIFLEFTVLYVKKKGIMLCQVDAFDSENTDLPLGTIADAGVELNISVPVSLRPHFPQWRYPP